MHEAAVVFKYFLHLYAFIYDSNAPMRIRRDRIERILMGLKWARACSLDIRGCITSSDFRPVVGPASKA